MVPSTRTILDSSLLPSQDTTKISFPQFTIKSLDEAVVVAICSSSALLRTFTENMPTSRIRTSPEFTWLFKFLELYWNAVLSVVPQLSPTRLASSGLATFIDIMERYLRFTTNNGSESVVIPKILALFAQVIDSITSPLEPLFSRLPIQKALCSLLLEVAAQCRRSSQFSQVCSEYLLSSFVTIEQWSHASTELRVSQAYKLSSKYLLI